MIPQILYLAMMLIGLGMTFAKHGEPKKLGIVNAWYSLIGALLVITLLYYGGFFAVFNIKP